MTGLLADGTPTSLGEDADGIEYSLAALISSGGALETGLLSAVSVVTARILGAGAFSTTARDTSRMGEGALGLRGAAVAEPSELLSGPSVTLSVDAPPSESLDESAERVIPPSIVVPPGF